MTHYWPKICEDRLIGVRFLHSKLLNLVLLSDSEIGFEVIFRVDVLEV
jgi:hypothetical protein